MSENNTLSQISYSKTQHSSSLQPLHTQRAFTATGTQRRMNTTLSREEEDKWHDHHIQYKSRSPGFIFCF
jgi:hypothetical protein